MDSYKAFPAFKYRRTNQAQELQEYQTMLYSNSLKSTQ